MFLVFSTKIYSYSFLYLFAFHNYFSLFLISNQSPSFFWHFFVVCLLPPALEIFSKPQVLHTVLVFFLNLPLYNVFLVQQLDLN